jgi:hypothetical protein
MNKSYNINNTVMVELTSKGLETLKDYWSGYNNQSIPGLKANVFTTEIWNLMNIFGSKIYMGGAQFFEKNIITIESDD